MKVERQRRTLYNDQRITTDNTEIQRIIRDYYQQQYDNKMENLEEMEEFLEKCNFPN